MKWLKRGIAMVVGAYVALLGFLYVMQESMLFTPTVVTAIHDYGFKSAVEDEWLDRPDGAKLHVVRFNKGGEKGLVLYFHGNGGHNGYSEGMAETFTSLGYEVAGLDYRGYGKSRGERSEKTMLEDAEVFYDTMVARRGGEVPVIVGWSLGTTFASHVAANREATEVILFAPMSSILDMGKSRYPWLPEWISRFPLRTDLKFSQIKAPVTIYHGGPDKIVPLESGIKLKEYFKDEDRYLVYDDANHFNIPWHPAVMEDIQLILH